MTYVLPRLARDPASRFVIEARSTSLEQLGTLLPRTSLDITWPAVGDDRIPTAHLRELRRDLLELAHEHGMPTTRSAAFDGRASAVLRRHLPLTPHEASHDESWTYLTCVWLLDIALWRFGPEADIRRFIGDVNRNTFRRLWWRAEILGDDTDLTKLGEDELVNITERPTLAADRRLARTLVREFLSAAESSDAPRQFLMREATKRILRLTPLVDFAGLSDQELSERVSEVFTQAAAALLGRPVPARLAEQHAYVPPAVSPEVTALSKVTVGSPDLVWVDSEVAIGTPVPRPRPEVTLAQAGAVAVDLARRTGRVTNENLRSLLSINAQQARQVLQAEVHRGTLVQRGLKRGTHYRLPPTAKPGAEPPAVPPRSGQPASTGNGSGAPSPAAPDQQRGEATPTSGISTAPNAHEQSPRSEDQTDGGRRSLLSRLIGRGAAPTVESMPTKEQLMRRAEQCRRVAELHLSGLARPEIVERLGYDRRLVSNLLRDGLFYRDPTSYPTRLSSARTAAAALNAGIEWNDYLEWSPLLRPDAETAWRDAIVLGTGSPAITNRPS